MKKTCDCQISKYKISVTNLNEEQVNKIKFRDLIDNLIQWSAGCQNLSKTAIVPHAALSNKRDIYLLDIKSYTNFYMIVLWIGIAGDISESASVVGINVKEALGTVSTQTKGFDENHVAGEPAVFILRKDDSDHIYSFTWGNHRQNRISSLSLYLTTFLNNHSKYNKIFAQESPVEKNTVIADLTIETLPDFYNKVSFKRSKKEVDREKIKNNIQSINRIIRTSSCRNENNLDLSGWEKMLEFFSKKIKIKNKQDAMQTRKTISTIRYTPTEKELLNLFEIYDNKTYGIEDIRFEFTNNSSISPISLSRDFESDEYTIPLEFYKETNVPNIQHLLKSIEAVL